MESLLIGRVQISLPIIASALLCLFAAERVAADLITIPQGNVIVTVTGTNPETQQGRTARFDVDVQSDGSFSLMDASSEGANWSLTDLDVSGNVDPFTNLNFAITNNGAVTLQFSVSVTLPIAPIGPGTVHGGSTGGALTDANNNGVATVATSAGVPFYQGQIDGATVLSIYPDPYSLSVAFAGQTVNIPALNPGLPGPTIPSGPATSTIGIINQFTLTAGDTISGNSFFIVELVPEPSTLGLAAAAMSATLVLRRRSKSPASPC